MKHKVTTRNDEAGRLVFVENERLDPPGSYLQFRFTDEGLIIDHYSVEHELLGTFGQMYDEITETLIQ